MLGLLGAIGFGIAKNPKATAKYTAKAFGTGLDAVKGANKLMGKMGSWEGPTKRVLGSAALGYGGYKAGGMAGDFTADYYIASAGDTEANQNSAANMRTAGRVAGGALGLGVLNAGSIARGVGATVSGLGKGVGKLGQVGTAPVAAANQFSKVFKASRVTSRVRKRRINRLNRANNYQSIEPTRGAKEGKAAYRKRSAISYAEQNSSNQALQKSALNAAHQPIRSEEILARARGLYPRAGDQRFIGPMPKTRSAVNKGRSLFSKAVDPSRDGFKKGLGYAGVGAALGVPITMGMESQMPSRKVSPEGNITGIASSPRGGISPELQMSTQGLTLGIHNRRKSRVM